jgi:hypothetical protein
LRSSFFSRSGAACAYFAPSSGLAGAVNVKASRKAGMNVLVSRIRFWRCISSSLTAARGVPRTDRQPTVLRWLNYGVCREIFGSDFARAAFQVSVDHNRFAVELFRDMHPACTRLSRRGANCIKKQTAPA